MITTTLNRIRAYGPCRKGWTKLLNGLGKDKADDEPLPFSRIIQINRLQDALWCCRAEPQYARLIAAAPELLEALQGVLWMAEEWFKYGGDETTFSDDYKESLDKARDAIAKAEGDTFSGESDSISARDK